jgi:hypothetical protein
VVAGAWEAIACCARHVVPAALAAHLLHPEPTVRAAAVKCWSIRREDAPPQRISNRLARDPDLGVRLALLGLLRNGDRDSSLRASLATDDPDAFARAFAQTPAHERTAA